MSSGTPANPKIRLPTPASWRPCDGVSFVERPWETALGPGARPFGWAWNPPSAPAAARGTTQKTRMPFFLRPPVRVPLLLSSGMLDTAMKPLPRKTRRAWNEFGHAHFVTYSCFRRLPLLTRDRTRRWVVEAFEFARTGPGPAHDSGPASAMYLFSWITPTCSTCDDVVCHCS